MNENQLLASLRRLFHNLEATDAVGHVMQATRAELDQTLGFNDLWFHLLSDDRTRLQPLQPPGLTNHKARPPEPLLINGDPFLEDLAKARHPVVVEDAQTDPRLNQSAARTTLHRTVIYIPTRLDHQRVGFFGTGSPGDEPSRRLKRAELEYLRVIANHVALVLDRALAATQARPTTGQNSPSPETEARIKLAHDLGLIGFWELDLETTKPVAAQPPHKPFQHNGQNHHAPATVDEWLSTVHPDDRAAVAAKFAQELAQAKSRINLEYRTPQTNGQVHWQRSEGVFLRDNSGRPARLVGCHVDITERVNMQEQLRLSEIQLKLFIEHAPVGIAMFDRQMNCLAASARWTAGYGKRSGDKAGQNHYQVHPDMPARWKALHQRALAGECLKNDGEHIAQPDGSSVWLSWTIRPWTNAEGQIGGIIMTGEDITQRKQLEMDVVEIATNEQQRIGQDLHDTVSQELTALRMLTKVLGDSLETDPDRIMSLVKQIESGLRRSMQQLRDIMRGLIPVEVQPDHLIPALTDLAERAERLGAARCILNCPTDSVSLPDTFTATQLFLIAKEAVHNALKHCGPKEIEIKLETSPELLMIVKNDCDHLKETMLDRHFGLGRHIMQNRAAIIGAKLSIETLKPNGMQVTCRLDGSPL